MRWFVAVTCAAWSVSWVVPAVHAADPAAQARKAAVKALKQNTKPILRTSTGYVATELDAVLAAIDDWDDQVKQLGFGAVGPGGLAAALSAFQRNVAFATRQFTDAFGDAEDESYDIALVAAIPPYAITNDFRIGGGGRCDEVLRKLRGALDQAIARIEKRLAKLAKRLRKQEHLSFAFHVEVPFDPLAPLGSANGHVVTSSPVFPPNIDAILAFSDVSTANDTEAIVIGSSYPSLMGVTVARTTEDFNTTSLVLQSGPDGRWTVSFASFLEGNASYALTIAGFPFQLDVLVLGVE